MRYAAALLALLYIGATRASASPPPGNTSAPSARFVTANGIKLHYLDWGGSRETILFLTGFNDTAHVYDDFAPRFTDRFHVLALTRRGFGESDKPKHGYDTSTRVEDIRQFLDVLGISKVSLIGHSMAGDELTLFAIRYPQRTRKLVYLDAAYDRTPEGWLEGLTDPTYKPDIRQRMRMEALGLPTASEIHVDKMPPPDEWAILVAMHKAIFAFRPDYTKIQAPALAFYAVTANEHYPSHWLPEGADASLRAKAEAWWQEKGHALMRYSVEQFRREIPHGEIVELDDAKHAEVEPVIQEGIRYVAPNDDGRRAYIEAWDVRTNKKLWELTVFTNCIDPKLEEDVQWVFIDKLGARDGTLMVKSESGNTYQVDLKTKAVTQPELISSPAPEAATQSSKIPEAIEKAVANGRLGKDYDVSSRVNPFYLDGDFNGDGNIDVAVLVKENSTGKIGIAIIHGGKGKVTILGAGNSVGNGGDDFEWIDTWQVYSKDRGAKGGGETSIPHLRGDALLVAKSDAASALIYWNGKRYVWFQQGD